MIPYFVPVDYISKEDVQFLENLVQSSEADFKAYDTVSGNKDGNLCWDINLDYFNRFNLNSYTFFVHQEPFSKVVSHTDNPKWKRNTVLIIPLLWHRNYAPCYFEDGPVIEFRTPYLFNTQLPHYVNNNEYPRYNFQICFEEPLEEVEKCLIPR
tara:strand:+ start:4286 stop:4747 length:462 start_codon:yes stop_codon:yes gene_type:complete